jgi:hypothetical protein
LLILKSKAQTLSPLQLRLLPSHRLWTLPSAAKSL